MRLLAALLIATPFLFGALRFAATSGADGRYLLVALAALAGAIFSVRRAEASIVRSNARTMAGIFVSTLGAATAAVLLGGRSVLSVGIVSIAFGACIGGGVTLMWRAQRKTHN
ncbi:MAG: hypothetical protein H3C62_09375 [Gemmatimonadaceae bacterium]|nr:hypothetical protein [Gemmatimonadaceae bacterium]